MKRDGHSTTLRQFLWIFVPVCLVACSVAVFIIRLQTTIHEQALRTEERILVDREAELLESELIVPVRDLLFLTRLAESHLVDQGLGIAQDVIQGDFSELGRVRFEYDQLRFLGLDGHERARVDLRSGKPLIRPRNELQDKSERDYFKRGMAAESGIFMSRLDLNVERGVVETPYRPTLRFTSIVRDPKASPVGLLVLNYDCRRTLTRLLEASNAATGGFQLLNAEGGWILAPSRDLDFHFLLSGDKAPGFAKTQPKVWNEINASRRGQTLTSEGLFTHRTLSLNRQLTISPSTREALTLVSVLPVHRLQPSWLGVGWASLGGTVAVMAALSLLLARARSRVLQSTLALKRSEERWSFALEAARDGVWDWDVPTDVVNLSPRWKEMLGYAQDEGPGSREEWAMLVHPEDRERIFAILEEHLRGKTPHFEFTHRVTTRAGGYRWVQVRGRVAERDREGRPLRAVGTQTDVTDRKQAEEQLAISRKNLAQAQAIAKLGSWDLDVASGKTIWSDEMYRIYGLEPSEASPDAEAYLESLHPEDGDRLRQVLQQTMAQGGSYVDRHRFITKSGQTIWVEARGEACRNENGDIIGLSGTIQDINESMLNRLELEEREGMLRAMSQASNDAFIAIQAEGRVVLWNPAAERLFGFKAEEVMGQPVHDLVASIEDAAKAAEGFRDFQTTGTGAVVGTTREMNARRRDGSAVPVELSVAAFQRGEKWYAVGSVRDITKRKENETRLVELATIDGLTGLNNRRHFMELAHRAMRQAQRLDTHMAGIMFDVDHFKNVNDTHGHDAGDAVLRGLSDLAVGTFRDIDILGRLGGEEFGVILPQAQAQTAALAAERLRAAVEAAALETPAGELRITVSIGVAVLADDVQDVEALLKRADQALYRAKQTGRNKVEAFAPDPEKD
ncbi:PAS domain S-box protein [Desulfocurvus sp. DL9XJH121]